MARCKKEIEPLDWTLQLYDLAHGEKGSEKKNQDELWNAIADSKLDGEIGAEVWKAVDPMTEELWTKLGNKEPFWGENKTYSTGVEK